MRLWLTAALAMTSVGAVCSDVTVGANGGIVRAAGEYRFELLVQPHRAVRETPIVFFVSDRDGKPVETKDARGHAEFSSGGLKGVATLHPDGANRMKGYGLMSAKPDLLIDVSISFPGHAPLHAQFKPLDHTGRQPTPR